MPFPHRPLTRLFTLCLVLAAAAPAEAAQEAPDLYELGRRLFEEYATPEVKEQYAYPSREEWDGFWGPFEEALRSSSLESLAALRPQAEHALSLLRAADEESGYADWLEARLDYFEAAADSLDSADGASPPPEEAAALLHYSSWLNRIETRPKPPRTQHLVRELKQIFAEEGVPEALVWLADVESSFNPSARSPVGALGLFQFMPPAAQRFGLRLLPFDERKHPRKSARAAARYLRVLYSEFSSWPLALAAYNAGEGRVRRLLKAEAADDFAAIAGRLPAETRLYVPKVLATVAVREQLDPDRLPPPAARIPPSG